MSGLWVALTLTGVTIVTFALAMTALPDKVPYPFTDPVIAAQWPGDYLWMYPAMLLMLLFVALVAAVHVCAPPARRVFSLLGLCTAVVAAAVLLIDLLPAGEHSCRRALRRVNWTAGRCSRCTTRTASSSRSRSSATCS